jgi:hypothetical protein
VGGVAVQEPGLNRRISTGNAAARVTDATPSYSPGPLPMTRSMGRCKTPKMPRKASTTPASGRPVSARSVVSTTMTSC